MFESKLFESQLSTSWLGKCLVYFEELESTNTYAKKLKSHESLHGTIILTDAQVAGRGQHARIWNTDPGVNLTFSLVLEPTPADRFIVLTLACALAIAEINEETTGQLFALKWPNDVMHQGRKICGLLTEVVYNGNSVDRVIIGIGLNVNQQEFPAELDQKATSLIHLTEAEIPREVLLTRILSKIEFYYRMWERSDIELLKLINKKLIGYGQWCQLKVNGEMLDGEYKFLGVNESGALLVLNKDLEVNTFSYEQVRVYFDSSNA